LTLFYEPDELFTIGSADKLTIPRAPSFIEVTVEFIIPEGNWKRIFGEQETPKIRNKLVDACTIQELLFAIRAKIREDQNGCSNKKPRN